MPNIQILLFMLLLSSFTASNVTLTRTDVQVLQSLSSYFLTGFCVLEKDTNEQTMNAVLGGNYPGKNGLLTVSLNYFQMSKFIINSENSVSKTSKTMIVWRMTEKSMWTLEKLSSGENITSTFTWVLFSEEPLNLEKFQNIYVPFDCEFLYVHRNRDHYNITELYNIIKGAQMETYHLGTWTQKTGLKLDEKPLYVRRNSFKGQKFIAVLNDNPPYVSIHRDRNGNPVFKGFFYEIWQELEAKLNFRTDFVEDFFDKAPNRILRRKEAEFALGRIPNNRRNALAMDFSQPLIKARFYAFGHRRGGELDWDSYLKPFSTSTWYVNLIWMMSSSLSLAVFYKLAWNFDTSERESTYYIFTFSESILTVFRAICMQGSDVTPKSYSCRLIFLSIYMTASVVTSAFSAALLSLLTVPKPKSHFNSLSELFSKRSYEIAFPSDPAFQRALESFSDFLWATPSTLKERIMESNFKLHLTAAEGLQRICEDKFLIFVYDMPNVLHIMKNLTIYCQNKIIPLDRPLFTEYIVFGYRKYSPYRKIINLCLTRMQNDGIINRIYLNSWPPQIPHIRTHWIEATFSDVSPILCLFAFGSFIGFLVLFIEKLIRDFKLECIFLVCLMDFDHEISELREEAFGNSIESSRNFH